MAEGKDGGDSGDILASIRKIVEQERQGEDVAGGAEAIEPLVLREEDQVFSLDAQMRTDVVADDAAEDTAPLLLTEPMAPVAEEPYSAQIVSLHPAGDSATTEASENDNTPVEDGALKAEAETDEEEVLVLSPSSSPENEVQEVDEPPEMLAQKTSDAEADAMPIDDTIRAEDEPLSAADVDVDVDADDDDEADDEAAEPVQAEASQNAVETKVQPKPEAVHPPVDDIFGLRGDSDDDLVGISRDELRKIVRDVIREELSGQFGARVSGNIQQMIRREIKRALDEQ